MSNTVFVLGAGASKEAGAPLMKDFLDKAHRLWKTGAVKDTEEHFSRVFAGISCLQAIHSKSQLDLQNIESVFAAFEMAKTLRAFPDREPEEIEPLISSLKTIIVQTLEQTVQLQYHHDRAYPSEPYLKFVELLRYLRTEAKPKESVSVLTFNYDMGLDYALYFYGEKYSYALDTPPQKNDISLLKLHGSLNWAKCPNCENVVPIMLESYLRKYTWYAFSQPTLVPLEIGSNLHNFKHCDTALDKEPVLVPPTWHKEDYHRAISNVWASAASQLKEAENIFVMGYSLPQADAFFRYLYALGTVGQTPLKRFWVFNPDETGEVKRRFEELLGPGAHARFEYGIRKFSTAIEWIMAHFPSK